MKKLNCIFCYLLLSFTLLIPNKLLSMTNEQFIIWWNEYKNNDDIPQDLLLMENYFIEKNLIRYSSKFWNYLNREHIQLITLYGYENFKQTVARNYFTFVTEFNNLYSKNLCNFQPINIKLPSEEITRVHPFFSEEESLRFNIISEAFLNYMVSIDSENLLSNIEEPLIGNPPFIMYNGKRLSQDIFNSLLEYSFISKQCSLNKDFTIIEVGAGSGRTAYTFLTLLPESKYIIVDIPPALFISQSYLCDVFPNKSVMKFRPFDNFDEIKEEFNNSDIVFLTPDQLNLIPNNTADLFLAIDCLHEMKLDQINFYFKEADRLADYIYFKCWKYTKVPYDLVVYTEDTYTILPEWTLLNKETCFVPSNFFQAIYKIK